MAGKTFGKNKIAVYLRENDQGPTVKEQLEAVRSHIQTLGLAGEVVCFLDDSDGRNAFQSMIREIGSGNFAFAICEKLECLDCVADDIEKLVLFMTEMEKSGTRFISIADHLDTFSYPSDCFLKITSAVDQAKAALRVERVRSSLRAAKSEGRAIGRPSGEHDEQILALRRSGLSIRAIAAKLGISPSTVQTALHRKAPAEAGL